MNQFYYNIASVILIVLKGDLQMTEFLCIMNKM